MSKLLFMKKKLQVRFVSAQIESVLQKLSDSHIVLYDISQYDALTMDVWIDAHDRYRLESVMQLSTTQYSVIAKRGIQWYTEIIFRRPVLILGALLFFVMTLWLPGKILFVQVEGNRQLPDKLILACADDCGIGFGADRRAVRSEKTKNELLAQIPQLQWVGVNTSGCVARISVQEGNLKAEGDHESGRVSAIIASTDGVIDYISALKGTAMCTAGQSVKAGDVLISGYTDCGLKTRAEMAKGEVFAFTNRKLTAVALNPILQKGEIIDKSVSLSIRIGKKLIKLWNDSGISDATCDKMYLEDYWTLPGDFRLPVVIVKEITIYRSPVTWDCSEHPAWLEEFAEDYLRDQMIAGKLLSKDIAYRMDEICWTMSGKYACHEMIGKVKCEETLLENAKDN